MNKPTPAEIATMTKEGTWPDSQEFNVLDFLLQASPDEYVPNPEKMLQVRKKQIDWVFVNKAVTKIETTGNRDGLNKKGTVVFFPEGIEYDGITIPAGTFGIIGGSHGTVISQKVGQLKKEYYLVNFKHDLDSSVLKLKRLGNKLNETFYESQGTGNDDIRNEFWSLMDIRIENGEDYKPTRTEKDDFLKDYKQISDQTLSLWISHHEEGGRRSSTIQYTQIQLDNWKVELSRMTAYKDYNILTPVVLGAWDNRALSQAVKESLDGLWQRDEDGKLDARQGKKKVLVPLWAKSATDSTSLEKGEIQKKITTRYEEWCKHIGFDAMEATYMPWK